MNYLLTDDARVELGRWTPKARALFDELLEDAGSDLQRELLVRAVAARHGPAEVHAFADQIRPSSDSDVLAACTVREPKVRGFSVAQVLKAHADPLAAFELNGGVIDPQDEQTPAIVPQGGTPIEPSSPLALPLGARRPTFDERPAPPRPPSTGARSPRLLELTPSRPSSAVAPFAEALLDEATRANGLKWKEADLDTKGGLPLADALEAAAAALGRGIPIPCIMGPGVGQHRRFVLLLQVDPSGPRRAWELYEPITRELVWANEGDLLLGRELPFANKVNRRLTRMVLPQPVGGEPIFG
jgi:hypothetical protein